MPAPTPAKSSQRRSAKTGKATKVAGEARRRSTPAAPAGATMVEGLRRALQVPHAASFQLMGEDLWLLAGADLHAAAARYDADLAALPARLRHAVELEQRRILTTAHGWLRRYNLSIHRRVQGYVALGRLCRYEYPWPVVAILGICQVMGGESKTALYSAIGQLAARAGQPFLAGLTDDAKDVLRRTNRGIFADSVPTVLYALHCHDLRVAGREDLAEALVEGPMPPLMDEENADLVRRIYRIAALADGHERYRSFSDLTLRHFGREQKIFSYNMGTRDWTSPPAPVPDSPLRRLLTMRRVPAPVVERKLGGRRQVAFKPYKLPAGFDMRDHEARVRVFGEAFVASVTADVRDYRAAAAYVERLFGTRPRQSRVDYAVGGMPATGVVESR